MSGLVLVDTLRLLRCQLIKNLLEALCDFVTPIFREAAALAEKPQKKLHSNLQLCHRFRHPSVTADAVTSKGIPIEKEPRMEILLEFLHGFFREKKTFPDP